jgi:hypothetical protein
MHKVSCLLLKAASVLKVQKHSAGTRVLHNTCLNPKKVQVRVIHLVLKLGKGKARLNWLGYRLDQVSSPINTSDLPIDVSCCTQLSSAISGLWKLLRKSMNVGSAPVVSPFNLYSV